MALILNISDALLNLLDSADQIIDALLNAFELDGVIIGLTSELVNFNFN
jgi:hypothetical protein